MSDRLWATFLLRLQSVVPDAAFGLASAVLGPLRAVKDADEIELLREAAQAADRVVQAIAAGRLVGRTEADVAREVRERLVDEGHDSANFWIVASGPNAASPHHEPAERVIQAGEPMVVDIGGTLGGYCSDITRTLWVTGDADVRPTDEFTKLYDVLQRAQAASTAAVKPGVECQDIDRAARAIIADAGMGELFIHRTGHGIGLEGHEDPYMVEGNAEPLAVGNAFSIEPGIYVEGRHGARIEDIVRVRRGRAGPAQPGHARPARRPRLAPRRRLERSASAAESRIGAMIGSPRASEMTLEETGASTDEAHAQDSARRSARGPAGPDRSPAAPLHQVTSVRAAARAAPPLRAQRRAR